MTYIQRILGAASVALALVAVHTTDVSTQRRLLGPRVQAPPRNVPGINRPVVVVTGSIIGPETWTANNYYVLRGAVFVEDGATLTIQPGTTVIGEAGSVGTLIVLRGGILNAIGTREQPIVFTSDQRPGSRARGDWGGLIINGRAPINVPGGVGVGEADTGVYGGTNPFDSSGSLKYVRIEFAGTEFSPDNELNGIAFQGVGNGGSYENIQVHMNRDDGLEWFGGTADIKRAVVSNAADDSFDWTFGWRGRAQFIAVHKRGDDGDWSIEADNNEFNNNLLPRSNPQIYNFTSCGDPDNNEGAEARRGVLFRRGTAVTFRNFILFGSHKGTSTSNLGLQIDGATTLAEVTNGTTQIGAGIITQATLVPSPANDVHTATAPFIANGRFPDVRLGVDAGLSPNCFNHPAPDFRPTSANTLAGGLLQPIQPPGDGFFEPVSFIGAVGPNVEDDWISGWTSFPQN